VLPAVPVPPGCCAPVDCPPELPSLAVAPPDPVPVDESVPEVLPVCEPVLEVLLVCEPVPLLPPLSCCCGNGDSLPPPDWLEPWLVLVLPPEVDGEEAGDEEPGGCGIDGGDGIDGLCVEVLVAQPASPSAQATGQTNALTMTSRMLSGLLGFAQRQGARRGL
jgi:hypothetical protein